MHKCTRLTLTKKWQQLVSIGEKWVTWGKWTTELILTTAKAATNWATNWSRYHTGLGSSVQGMVSTTQPRGVDPDRSLKRQQLGQSARLRAASALPLPTQSLGAHNATERDEPRDRAYKRKRGQESLPLCQNTTNGRSSPSISTMEKKRKKGTSGGNATRKNQEPT